MSEILAYSLVTPARNEGKSLRRLAASVLAQTVLPDEWMIVDDGSTDETREVADLLARRHQWIRLVDSPRPTAGAIRDGRTSGRDIIAFNAGVDALDRPVDVLVKLDADVSFQPEFFERLLTEFVRDASLGIASGTCYELVTGHWVVRHVAGEHVRGATRAWRWACFEDIQPLEKRLGWDTVDELKANALGWRTRQIPIPFFHHRAVGQRDGRLRSWSGQGETAYFVGYRFWYLVAKAVYRARREPQALALLWGYLAALATRRPRYPDRGVRNQLRRKQSLRSFRIRVREATGRSAP
jgi:poly-beta-1,6-N-acetyl-D-glucosamine synthase